MNVIWELIAQDNPAAADRLVAELYDRVRLLAKFARIGHSRPDLVSNRPVLFSSVRKYFVIYEVRDSVLVVLGVLHADRNIPSILRHRKSGQ